MKENKIPDCFSRQGEAALFGETPFGCLGCEVFDRCHKLSVASSLAALCDNFDLVVQNGLDNGSLKPFKKLTGFPRDLETGQEMEESGH